MTVNGNERPTKTTPPPLSRRRRKPIQTEASIDSRDTFLFPFSQRRLRPHNRLPYSPTRGRMNIHSTSFPPNNIDRRSWSVVCGGLHCMSRASTDRLFPSPQRSTFRTAAVFSLTSSPLHGGEKKFFSRSRPSSDFP